MRPARRRGDSRPGNRGGRLACDTACHAQRPRGEREPVRRPAATLAPASGPQPAHARRAGRLHAAAPLVPGDGPFSSQPADGPPVGCGPGGAAAGAQPAAAGGRARPASPQADVQAPVLEPFRRAMDRLLAAHEPFPALVLDAHTRVVAASRASSALFGGGLVGGNLVERYLADPGLRAAVVNWPEIAWAALDRLGKQLRQAPFDQEFKRLVVLAEAAVAGMPRPPGVEHALVACPWFRVGDAVIRTIVIAARFDTAVDVTLDELRIELIYPQDPPPSGSSGRPLDSRATTSAEVCLPLRGAGGRPGSGSIPRARWSGAHHQGGIAAGVHPGRDPGAVRPAGASAEQGCAAPARQRQGGRDRAAPADPRDAVGGRGLRVRRANRLPVRAGLSAVGSGDHRAGRPGRACDHCRAGWPPADARCHRCACCCWSSTGSATPATCASPARPSARW
jgi:hypothetical protein